MKRGEIGKVKRVTNADSELLELCHQLDDPKQVLKEAIKRQKLFKRVSLAKCCDRYIEEYANRASAMTRRDANTKTKTIKDTLGERYIDSLTQRDIEKWRDSLPGSNRYVNNIHAHLRHLFERARVWGYVPPGHNPAREVRSLKIAKKEPEIWEPETLHKCLEWYAREETAEFESRIAFLALGAFAGMRPSEIEGVVGERNGLLWEDIDFEQRHIRIRPEVAGKLAEPRYITFTSKPNAGLGEELADQMWDVLTKWLIPIQEKSGPVTIRKCQRQMSPELKEAKLIEKWPSDGLRHTWISSLLALGVSRNWIAELAGNSPEVIRTNYKRPLPEEVAKEWFYN